MEKSKKLSVWLLVFIAIGSMIGSGIFNSPKDLIGVANPQGAMITWLIGGFGAMMLALVFVYLNHKKPELQSGIFDYAREGFGDYMGFNSAWGYWSMGWLGNISYLLLFFKTLNDILGENALSPIACFIIGSGINWIYFFIISAGIKEGAVTNLVVTFAKLIPILLVIILGVFIVQKGIFNITDWKFTLASTANPTTPALQIKSAMAIVLWCFVGMEASSVLSGRAKSQKAVRYATIISFLTVLVVYILITFVAMSSVSASELYGSKTPLALVLERTQIGKAGSFIVQIGIMISVVGAGLSWLLLSTETMYSASNSGVMPKILTKENKNGVPINSLLLSLVFTQFFLLSVLSPTINNSYVVAITLATSLILIPYLLSSLYALKIAFSERKNETPLHLIVAFISTIYSGYVIYTVGMKYVFLAILFYALGAVLFYLAKKERNEKIKKWELITMWMLIIGAIFITYLIAAGQFLL